LTPALVDPADTFLICAILFGLATLGFWVDGHRVFKKTSGALWIIVAGVALSNLRITPFHAESYDLVFSYLVSLAIPLLLFKANLTKIIRESGKILITFLCATLATITAAVLTLYLVDLGENGPQVASVIASGYIGGTMNFVAVSQAVNLSPELFTVTIGANSVVSVIALMILIALPSIAVIQRCIPSRIISEGAAAETTDQPSSSPPELKLTHTCLALAISFSICALSSALARILDIEQYNILLVTTFSIILASFAPRLLEKLEGDFDLGLMMMYLFFAAIGLSTNVTAFIDSALNLFFYALILVALHLVLVLVIARIFRFDLAETVIGSAAALVGPGPTAAIASANSWHKLVTPGILCGLLGYIIANFIGVTMAQILA